MEFELRVLLAVCAGCPPFRLSGIGRHGPAQDVYVIVRGAAWARAGSYACAASAFGKGVPLSNTLFTCGSLAAGLKYRVTTQLLPTSRRHPKLCLLSTVSGCPFVEQLTTWP